MSAHLEMERVLACVLGHALVDHDAARLERLTGQLLLLAGHEMDAQRKLVGLSILAAHVIDLDLGVRDTAAEARLGVRLVLAVAIAAGRT